MLIDWFTVGAQALNFAILVWLMQRYLYRPVLDAVDAREKRISAELADAATRKQEASDERAEFLQKNKIFDAERAGLLGQATESAGTERKRLLTAASLAADALAVERQDALRDEADALQRALGLCARREVFAIAREVLSDLASAGLEERVCAVFLDRLRALDAPARERLVAAFAAATEPALLRSAFDLPEAQRTAIQKVVDDAFAAKAALRFETSPDLVAGIELSVGGQRLDWSIAHHVDSLEKSVAALVKQTAIKA